MDCPVCKVPLIVVEREKIELDHCVSCKGIWFDQGELELLPEALHLQVQMPNIQTLPSVSSKEQVRHCPRCRKKMDKVLLTGVLVDRCVSGHGLWFDWGEVGQVLERTCLSESRDDRPMIKFLGETIRPKKSAD